MSIFSLPFLFGIFPLFYLIYFFTKPKYRVYEVGGLSLLFFCINDFGGLIVILAISIICYLCALKNTKAALIAGIAVSVGTLVFYKYYQYFIEYYNTLSDRELNADTVVLALGQSFITFSLISYLVDVYKGVVLPQKNFFKFLTYVIMFPKVMMGPIVRYSDIEPSFKEANIALEDISEGIQRIVIGFCKKAIIADNLLVMVDEISKKMLSDQSIATLWIGALAYSLELFFDFAGYSDMAIGIARMLGYRFKENFNYPYACESVTDFWRRWHISLSLWFRDYVYIPLGGSRKSALRNVINLLAVWLLTAIWHGTGFSFLAWGMVFFTLIVLERYLIKPQKMSSAMRVVYRIVILLIIAFNWVLFWHNDLSDGIRYCAGMLGIENNVFANSFDIRLIREWGIYLIIGVLLSFPIVPKIREKVGTKMNPVAQATVETLLMLIIFIWAMSFVILGHHNPFMYQQF